MNREIKFRVWDEKSNCWDKGGFYLYANEPIQKQGYIIQQYTGCLDCSKTEIYEGDIIQVVTKGNVYFDSETVHGNVIFESGSFMCHFKESDSKVGLSTCISDTTTTILGNIFENPELLK